MNKKIAFIITDKVELLLGDCLSSAKVFYIYEEASRSFKNLSIPKSDIVHQKAKLYAAHLVNQGITNVVGLDIGPKAKAAIEEFGMQWKNVSKGMDKQEIINQIINE